MLLSAGKLIEELPSRFNKNENPVRNKYYLQIFPK
jgi:hypothetical protein